MKLNNTKYKLEMKKLFLLLAVVVVAVNAVSQNIENGHAYVDLGLPSGLKWADANVGASKTEDFGTHYAWGDAQAKKSYNWSVYKWGKVKNQLTKYCNESNFGKNGFTDNKLQLDLSEDIANISWGGQWRMPTTADFEELLSNTTTEWVENYNGTNVKGYRFIAANGNSIFFPAAGYRYDTSHHDRGTGGFYWSSTLYTLDPNYAHMLVFDLNGVFVDNYDRCCGLIVRPVHP